VGDSYDFSARNLTAYGGLLPVATMLEKLGFQQLVEETLTIGRQTRAMPVYRFVLGMVLVLYVGFSRLNHLRFVEREPMLTGILKVLRVPPQCTFWRFLASLHLSVARQLLRVQQVLRQRVWQAAHVDLKTITLDTDTTVNTLFGHQHCCPAKSRTESFGCRDHLNPPRSQALEVPVKWAFSQKASRSKSVEFGRGKRSLSHEHHRDNARRTSETRRRAGSP
jgi:hypothetical protein